MKILILSILTLIILLGCDQNREVFKSLRVGDKFVLQNSDFVDIAREDTSVCIYRYHEALSPYYYYSTTRKDSIIYEIRSVKK